jgi:hypothetical protein
MVAVPAETPFTTPIPFIVATAVLLLTHDTNGVVASLNVVVEPWQADVVPAIAAGVGLMVTFVVL